MSFVVYRQRNGFPDSARTRVRGYVFETEPEANAAKAELEADGNPIYEYTVQEQT